MMFKHSIACCFLWILLFSIATPSYFTIAEEISRVEIADVGEEEKKGKEASKDIELKNCYASIRSQTHVGLEKKKRIGFYLKDYISYQKKMTCPPPESFI